MGLVMTLLPRDYDNVCKMLQRACLTDSDVTLAHVGRCGVPEPCPSFCPTRGELSFCGDDGVTYPRRGHCDAQRVLITQISDVTEERSRNRIAFIEVSRL